MIENKGTSNLIIILPTMGAQGSRPNCTNQLSNMSIHQISSDQLEDNTKMENNQEYYHLQAIRQLGTYV